MRGAPEQAAAHTHSHAGVRLEEHACMDCRSRLPCTPTAMQVCGWRSMHAWTAGAGCHAHLSLLTPATAALASVRSRFTCAARVMRARHNAQGQEGHCARGAGRGVGVKAAGSSGTSIPWPKCVQQAQRAA